MAAADETDLVNYLRSLYSEARNERRNLYDTWYRNYRLVHNRQANTTAQAWMPAPKDSEVYPTVSTLVAWMADQNTSVTAIPASDPHGPTSQFMNQLSRDLSTVLTTNWHVLDYRSQIKLALWDAFTYGIGIFKTVWDQGLDFGLGNAMLRRCDPWAVYVDPNGTSFADAEYVVEARRMSFSEVERRWPETYHKISDLGGDGTTQIDAGPRSMSLSNTLPTPGNLRSSGTIGNLGSSNAMTRWSVPTSSSQRHLSRTDTIVVYEFWLKENESYSEEIEGTDYAERRVGESWRVVVMAGGEVLMDERASDLFTHGTHPYDRYVFDDVGEFYGVALVDHLASPQIYINRLLTALQHSAELTGNPVMLEPTNSGLARVGIVNRPGTRLKVNQQSMQTPPTWMTPPTMSNDVPKLIDFWISRVDNISGQSAMKNVNLSRTAEGVNASVQEAAFVRIRSGLANLEASLESAASKLADLIVDNYTEPRFMAIVGPNGQQSMLALDARHFNAPNEDGATPLKYTIKIEAGSAAPTSRTSRMAEADMAFALGAIDRQAWLEAHNYPNWPEINERINKLQAMGLFQPPGARQRAQRRT